MSRTLVTQDLEKPKYLFLQLPCHHQQHEYWLRIIDSVVFTTSAPLLTYFRILLFLDHQIVQGERSRLLAYEEIVKEYYYNF